MLTHTEAAELAASCLSHSLAGDRPMAVVVVDAQGGVLYLRRSAGLSPLLGELTIAKAFTAATFDLPKDVVAAWQRHKPVLHMQLSTFDRYPVVPMEGAVTLLVAGTVIGGLAVSCRGASEDQLICTEAVEAHGYDGPETPA